MRIPRRSWSWSSSLAVRLLAAASSLAGCGQMGLEPVPELASDTGASGLAEAGGATSGTERCTYDGFPVLIHQATQDISDPMWPLFVYQARDVETLPFDELQITSYQGAPFYGPSTPGRYSLDGSNYGDCGLCVLLITDCTDGYSCDRVHFADRGSLEVVDFGDRSGQFRATLRDAVFREVEFDPATYWSTPVPGGDSWCVDELEIQVDTQLYY